MASTIIYAVVAIPIDINSKICSINVTDPSVYHCGSGGTDDKSTCPTGDWCYAEYTGIGTLNCSCVPAVSLPAVQGSKPNPYNWMANLVNIPAGTSGPSIVLPNVNGNLPHNLPAGTATILDNSFTGYADQTPTTLINGKAGVGYLIVTYDLSWFTNQQDITNFLNNPIWSNFNSTFSYNNIQIASLKDQFNNQTPGTPSSPSNNQSNNHNHLVAIIVIIVILIIIIIAIFVIIYINHKKKKQLT